MRGVASVYEPPSPQQLLALAMHVDKRALEPYVRYTLTHWSRP